MDSIDACDALKIHLNMWKPLAHMARIIYKHTSPSGKSYIGQTKYTLLKRWKEHVATARARRDGCPAFHAALRKYDPATHAWTSEILQEGLATKRDADDAEMYWIDKHGTRKKEQGYNCSAGGTFAKEPDEPRWRQRSVGLRLFVSLYGRWPSQASDDPLERKVASWVRFNKAQFSMGRLSEERRVVLESIALPANKVPPHKLLGWQWDGRDAQYDEGLRVTKEWYASNPNRHPRRVLGEKTKNNVEDRAFNFVTNRRREKKRDELCAERAAELDALEGWSWTGRGKGQGTVAQEPPYPYKYTMWLRSRARTAATSHSAGGTTMQLRSTTRKAVK